APRGRARRDHLFVDALFGHRPGIGAAHRRDRPRPAHRLRHARDAPQASRQRRLARRGVFEADRGGDAGDGLAVAWCWWGMRKRGILRAPKRIRHARKSRFAHAVSRAGFNHLNNDLMSADVSLAPVNQALLFQRLRWRLWRNTLHVVLRRSLVRVLTILLCSLVVWASLFT